jgi:hypothetical protein
MPSRTVGGIYISPIVNGTIPGGVTTTKWAQFSLWQQQQPSGHNSVCGNNMAKMITNQSIS